MNKNINFFFSTEEEQERSVRIIAQALGAHDRENGLLITNIMSVIENLHKVSTMDIGCCTMNDYLMRFYELYKTQYPCHKHSLQVFQGLMSLLTAFTEYRWFLCTDGPKIANLMGMVLEMYDNLPYEDQLETSSHEH